MHFSAFGEKFTRPAGIVSLMEDLGDALRVNPDMLFMGGGNPAQIPAATRLFTDCLQQVVETPADVEQMLGVYQAPQGDPRLLDDLAGLLRREYGWPLTRANLALANGSQSAFFVLFNLLAGTDSAGVQRHIQLPLVPEYLGYNELGLESPFFIAQRPTIDRLDETFFKYRVDFEHLQIGPESAALCVSRPTNPTGNVLTDAEMAELDSRARAADIPLIVDGAYGMPFPDIVFGEATPAWNINTVLVLSLSKLGLPGVRTSVVIANEELIRAFANANTVLSLAVGNLGPALLSQLIEREQLLCLSRDLVQPFYRERMQAAVALVRGAMKDLPCRIHAPEGAIFLWLWFEDLPVTSEVLYQRLKTRGVLVISGHHFFPGLAEPWQHRHQCLRLSYAQSDEVVTRAVAILAEEARLIYAEGEVKDSG